MTASIDHELLVSQAGWLRRLAVELVGPDRADDVLQDTWLAALRHPPQATDASGVRAWLASVVRNLARFGARTDAHRERRERDHARPEHTPSVEASIQQATLQQELMNAVMSLEVTQRDVVVLRYFDELQPREIAERLGIGAGAVRSRLARARVTLRERLELEGEPHRKAWLAGILGPWAGEFSRNATLGGIVLKAQVQVALIVFTTLSVGSVLWWSTASPGAAIGTPEPASAPAPRSARAAEREQRAVPVATGSNARERVPEERSATPPTVDPAEALLGGRVIDTGLRPVAGVAVVLVTGAEETEVARALAGADGAFELSTSRLGRLVVRDSEYVTVLDAAPSVGEYDELVIVVAPRRTYAGIVRDEGGQPLANVDVNASIDPALLRTLRPGIRRSVYRPGFATRTNGAGRFELRDIGWTVGAKLDLRAGGFEPHSLPLPEASREDLELVLRRPLFTRGSLDGQVVDRDGNPIADALVYANEAVLATDRDGRFALDPEVVARGGVLRALHNGFLPAELDLGALHPNEAGAFAPVLLRMGGVTLAIEGRVLDASRKPVAGVHVLTRDGVRLPRNSVFEPRTVEEFVGEQGDAVRSSRHVVTDDDGRFRLFGLLERDYLLWAFDGASLAVASPGRVRAGGPSVDILFDANEPTQRVAGRVVSLGGEPIEGVHVLFGRKGSLAGETYFAPLTIETGPFTDADGRFEAAAICADGAYVIPAAERTGGGRYHLAEFPDLGNVEIRVPLACTLQVLLESDPEEADSFRVLDRDGNALRVKVATGTMIVSGGAADLKDGKSEVVTVDERAHTLVFYKDAQEVYRRPVALTPDEVAILRL